MRDCKVCFSQSYMDIKFFFLHVISILQYVPFYKHENSCIELLLKKNPNHLHHFLCTGKETSRCQKRPPNSQSLTRESPACGSRYPGGSHPPRRSWNYPTPPLSLPPASPLAVVLPSHLFCASGKQKNIGLKKTTYQIKDSV